MAVRTYSLKKDGNNAVSANFRVSAFRCKYGSDKILIDDGLVTILERIRANWPGCSITITSAYRTTAYNRKVGGAKASQHIQGTAADIKVFKGNKQIATIDVARFAETIGVGGIGKYGTFTHVDNRATKSRWGFTPKGSVPVKTFGSESSSIPIPRQSPPNEELELIEDNWLLPREPSNVPTSPIIDDRLATDDLEIFYEDRENGDSYKLVVLDDCTLAHTADLKPSIFKFSVIDDNELTFNEGAAILVKDHGVPIFKGYIFSHENDDSGIVKVTAYDQLRYFDYQDTYIYENQSVGDILNYWINYFGLKKGFVTTGSFRIPQRDEWGKSIAEMLSFALEQTIVKTGQLLVIYDQAGEINLRYASDLHFIDYYIRINDAVNFKVTHSIDDDTYNQVKLAYKNEETGITETYQAHDADNIGKWGLLQYYEEVQDQARAAAYATQMLRSKNRITRTFNIKEVPAVSAGHIRAGMTVTVVTPNNSEAALLRVLAITHTWVKGRHLMDMNLFLD